MTTQNEIRGWLERGKRDGATHVIVVCDSFDHDDYPVFVKPTEDVNVRIKEFDGKNMQRIMEVYALHLPLEAQLAEYRSFHCDRAPAPIPPSLRSTRPRASAKKPSNVAPIIDVDDIRRRFEGARPNCTREVREVVVTLLAAVDRAEADARACREALRSIADDADKLQRSFYEEDSDSSAKVWSAIEKHANSIRRVLAAALAVKP
jgi:hypothetical protein